MPDLTLAAGIPKRTLIESHGRGAWAMYQRPKDGKYEVAFTAHGKRKFRTLQATKITQARAEATKVAQDEQGKKKSTANAKKPETLRVVAEEYFEDVRSFIAVGDMSQRTHDLYRQRYRTHIHERLGHRKVTEIDTSDVNALMRDTRNAGLSSWTRHGILTTLGAILAWAKDNDYPLDSIPTREITKRPEQENAREVHVFSQAEVVRILHGTHAVEGENEPKKNLSDRWRPLTAFVALTGARASEACGLTWGDIDLTAGTLTFAKQLSPKGERVALKTTNSKRTIPLGKQLRNLLVSQQIAAKPGATFVFGCETGSAPSYRNFARAFGDAVKDARIEPGEKRASLHSLRHTVASALIREGWDAVRVAAYLGDDAMTVMKVYAHEFTKGQDKDEVAAADVLGEALGVSGGTVS